MAAPIRPSSVKTYGRDKWVFVPTLTSQTAPSLAEINAASALDVSKMLFHDTAKPSQSTNLVRRERRLGDTTTFEQVGTTDYSLGELKYQFAPQAAALSDGKKAFEKFPEGTTGFMVRRMGIAVDTDMAVGQFVDTYPVEVGPQMPTETGDGDTAESAFVQSVAVTGPPTFNRAIVA